MATSNLGAMALRKQYEDEINPILDYPHVKLLILYKALRAMGLDSDGIDYHIHKELAAMADNLTIRRC